MDIVDHNASKEKKYKHKSGHEKRLKAAKKKLEKIASDPNQKKTTWFKDQARKRLVPSIVSL